QVFDGVEAGLAVGDVHVQVVLLALLVDRDAFEDHVVVVARFDRAGLEDRILDAVLGHAVLDQVDPQVNPAGHFDGAAEGDFTVALAEVQVADRQAAAFDVNRGVDLGTARPVPDVAVAAMLARWPAGGASGGGLGLFLAGQAAPVRGFGVGQVGEAGYTRGIGFE